MNREQMIAWLTLEGWRFYPAASSYLNSVRRGGVIPNQDIVGYGIVDEMVAYRDGVTYYAKHASVCINRPEGSLSDAPIEFIGAVYARLSSQMS